MRSAVYRFVIPALLLVCIALLVPAATPVAVGSHLQVGPFRLTAYGACAAAGTFLAAILTLWLGRKRKLRMQTVLGSVLSGVAGALLGARILYCAAMIESIAVDYGLLFILRLWEGGYTLYGGVLGGLLGIALYARLTKQQPMPLLDLAAPGAALFLMIVRFGEGFTSQGLGFYVDTAAFQFFPFAVPDAYGYWNAPVYIYEALAALLIAVFCLRALSKGKPGRPAVLLIALLSLSQILLDSWRHDEYIRFGFVHFNQLAAVAALAVLLLISVIRAVKQNGWNAWTVIRSAVFAPLVGVLIWVEFALEKSDINNVILYLIMAASLAAMGFAVLYDGNGYEKDKADV